MLLLALYSSPVLSQCDSIKRSYVSLAIGTGIPTSRFTSLENNPFITHVGFNSNVTLNRAFKNSIWGLVASSDFNINEFNAQAYLGETNYQAFEPQFNKNFYLTSVFTGIYFCYPFDESSYTIIKCMPGLLYLNSPHMIDTINDPLNPETLDIKAESKFAFALRLGIEWVKPLGKGAITINLDYLLSNIRNGLEVDSIYPSFTGKTNQSTLYLLKISYVNITIGYSLALGK